MIGPATTAILSHWRRHPGQCLTLFLGLALATALWSGVQAINAEARAAYRQAASVLGQDQLARLDSPWGGPIPLADYINLRRAGYLVSPVIEGTLGTFRLLGIDPLTAPPEAQPTLLAEGALDVADFTSGAGLILLSADTLPETLPDGLPPVRTVKGLMPRTGITDIAIAARLLGQSDPSYLLVLPRQPAGLPDLAGNTPGLRLTEGGGFSTPGQLTDSFHLSLTAFGLLAFAVGLFIVHAATGLAFEQRRASFRTLRALGLPLRTLIAVLLAELLAFALIAGGVGLILGYAMAAVLMPGVAGTLRGLYGAEVSGEVLFRTEWGLAGLGIAVLGTVAAAGHGVLRVARLPLLAPAQPRAWAIASGQTMRWQSGAALVLFATAFALALFGTGLAGGFACLAALLIGAALALPPVLAAVLGAIRWPRAGPMAEWLWADTRQQLPGLSLALMALLLALAANIGVSTMVGSFRGTFLEWLDQRLASELYVTVRNKAEARALRDALSPRVDAILPVVSVAAVFYDMPADLYGIADHATYRDHWPLLSSEPDVWDRVARGTGILVNEQLARRTGLTLGDAIPLATDWDLPLVGVYPDYGNPAGQAIIGLDLFAERFPDIPHLALAIRTDPGSVPALIRDLQEAFALPPRFVVDQSQVKHISLQVFEQTFRITGALNALTLGVAAFALLTSLLTLSRMRLAQLAPVWAIGQTRRRLAVIEMVRSGVLTLLTFVLAIPVGLALARVLLTVVNVEAFGWRLPMRIFPADWLRLGLCALLAAALAEAWPAWCLARTAPAQLLKVFTSER
ncbi:MAG: ABC transporter permease [Rhodobacteraceae bacterium]|nr:ABC transporter permease [Paracoccaceae bacterium]